MKQPSYAQCERQRTRSKNGQYEKMASCELCGKPVGAKYYSDERVDSKFGGLGLTLCKKDATKLSKLPDAEALLLLQEAERKRREA
jgi:hypothetical protein